MDDTPSALDDAAAAAHSPRDINVDLKDQRMSLTWADGRVSAYDLAELRRACPCATCREDRRRRSEKPEPGASGSLSLPILAIPAGVERIEVVDARLVGSYAINLRWSDGHDTGIFDYRYLRQLADGSSNP